MGSFRHNAARANAETPLLIIGGLLVAVAILAIFQRQLRRRARLKQYHPALELQSNGVLGQIQRRKDDLSRFVAKLQSQLAIRQHQLHLHSELEEMVTARVETARQLDQDWKELMRAGKKLHGKKWTEAAGDGQLSLRELMELHKDELLEMKASMDTTGGGTSRREKRPTGMARAKVTQFPIVESSKPRAQRSVPPEWQSTRRTAGSLATGQGATENDLRGADSAASNPWSMHNFGSESTPSSPPIVPKLDLSRLGNAAPTPSVGSQPTKKQSFEEMFQRQAKLASTLNRKKK